MNLKKDLAIVGGLFLLLAFLLIFGKSYTSVGNFGFGGNSATKSAQTAPSSTRTNGKVDIRIKDLRINAVVADTKDKRQKGLSNSDELAIGEGMLFVFEKPDSYAIWMKDMKFPIDIIWIADDKKIVDIVQNAVPEPGKKDEELKIYRPKAPAKYILEINAGLSSLNNLQIGDPVNIGL